MYIFIRRIGNGLSLKEELGHIYSFYELKDGSIFLNYNKIDYRIVTELIEAYSSMWDYEGPIFFAAYTLKKADIDFKKFDTYEQVSDYVLRIESAKDHMGLEIFIDPEQISETELIERIQSVTEKYNIKLKLVIRPVQ